MTKSKLILAVAIVLVSLSSCGIFKKGCGCPHFGKIKCADFKCAGIC
jgi:hypothetical protein